MYRLLFMIFATFAVVQLTNAAALSYYQHEIRQGRCTGDRLVHEDIMKPGAAYTTRKLTYTWKGNDVYFITCLNVYNRMSDTDAGTVRILEGGLGQSQAIIEMISKNGKGLHFYLEIYGELRRNPRSIE